LLLAEANLPEEMKAVLDLSEAERYEHFVREVVRREEAWGLAAEGWAQVSDHTRTSAMGLWPAAEYAELCATAAWAGYAPQPISLRTLLHQLLPALEDEGLWVLVFPTPTVWGVLVNAVALAEELTRARASR
jgi:hypothetical protein